MIKLKKVHSVLGYIVGSVLCVPGQGNYCPWREGEGGVIWENGIETCIISYMK